MENCLVESNATSSTADNYGHTKPIGQDKRKENKQAKNDKLPQRDERSIDNDQKLQEANAHKQENPIIEKRNGISNMDTHLLAMLRQNLHFFFISATRGVHCELILCIFLQMVSNTHTGMQIHPMTNIQNCQNQLKTKV